MSQPSIFDIAGPVMVGPSSSHTAGACKIGQFARALFNRTPKHVRFYLHGSFGEVYQGHATDRALLAGIMKFKTRDERIKNSFEIARSQHIDFQFIVQDLGKEFHPNTVKIELGDGKRRMSVIGSSIGGGMIKIVRIDDFSVNIHGQVGKYKTLVACHDRTPHILPQLKNAIQAFGVRIADLEASSYEDHMLHVFNLDGRNLLLKEVLDLEKIPGVHFVRSLSKLEK